MIRSILLLTVLSMGAHSEEIEGFISLAQLGGIMEKLREIVPPLPFPIKKDKRDFVISNFEKYTLKDVVNNHYFRNFFMRSWGGEECYFALQYQQEGNRDIAYLLVIRKGEQIPWLILSGWDLSGNGWEGRAASGRTSLKARVDISPSDWFNGLYQSQIIFEDSLGDEWSWFAYQFKWERFNAGKSLGNTHIRVLIQTDILGAHRTGQTKSLVFMIWPGGPESVKYDEKVIPWSRIQKDVKRSQEKLAVYEIFGSRLYLFLDREGNVEVLLPKGG